MEKEKKERKIERERKCGVRETLNKEIERKGERTGGGGESKSRLRQRPTSVHNVALKLTFFNKRVLPSSCYYGHRNTFAIVVS